MVYDPNQQYAAGASTDPTQQSGTFPTATGLAQNTDDSLYGVSAKLATIPVAIDLQPEHQGLSRDPQGAGGPIVKPLESALADFYQMTPAERATVQQQMYAAGYYPKSYYGKNPDIIVPGEADSTSFAAWKTLIEDTARSSTYEGGKLKNPKSVAQVLQERIGATNAAGSAAAGKQNPAQLTNPSDLETVLHNAAQNVLGFAPSPSDLTNFVNIYHGTETAAAQQDPTSGNVTQAPNATAFAEQWLRDRYPVEAGVNKTLNYGNEIVNDLTATAGGTLPVNSQVVSGG